MNNFVTIEGCIGAGKTTVTKLLAEKLQCKSVYENFEDNPYLQNFYENPEKHAFPLELYFMAERYQQQKKLYEEINLFDHQLISDYAFFKSMVFANITLKDDELQLFKMLFQIIYANIKSPDLIIYLYKSEEVLLKNIEKRARVYEQNIEGKYLNSLHHNYMQFFKQQEKSKVVILDTSHIDFIKQPEKLNLLTDIINGSFNKKINYY